VLSQIFEFLGGYVGFFFGLESSRYILFSVRAVNGEGEFVTVAGGKGSSVITRGQPSTGHGQQGGERLWKKQPTKAAQKKHSLALRVPRNAPAEEPLLCFTCGTSGCASFRVRSRVREAKLWAVQNYCF
jgi:uncharacterized protein YceK